MDRVPEPELMDDPAQAAAYAAADFSQPHGAFVAYFGHHFPGFRQGRVLDLGCGPGDVTIRFARAYPLARLTGVDGAPAMLTLARRAVEAAGLAHRITLEQRRLAPGQAVATGFDAIISNSLLHHLDDPAVLWQTVASTLEPGAAVLVMDLLRPVSRAAARELMRQHAEPAAAILRRDFYYSLLAAYRPPEVRAQLRAAGLGHLQVGEVSDGHLLVWGTR
jgi:trans-aconitate methyltransferase